MDHDGEYDTAGVNPGALLALDAAGGIPAHIGASGATPVDAGKGPANASSNIMTAPSATVPSGDTSDTALVVLLPRRP